MNISAPHKTLAVTYRPLAEIKAAARNARTHSPEQVQQLVRSIREFGWTNPVLVDETCTLIAGHGRLEAAKAVGLPEVPAITLAGLSAAQKRALAIADNKLALNAGWDDATLRLELGDLGLEGFDVSLIGFGADELEDLLGDDDGAPTGPEPAGSGYSEQYGVIVICKNEAQQQEIYERLHGEGLEVKVVAT